MDESNGTKRTFVEQVEVSGGELVDRVRDLIADSSARRVIIRNNDGDELLTVPLTFGVVAGGILTVAAPLLAALGALAALVTRVKLEVVREVEDESAASGEGAAGTGTATGTDAGTATDATGSRGNNTVDSG